MLSGQHENTEPTSIHDADGAENVEEETVARGRTRGGVIRKEGIHKVQPRNHIEGYNALDEMEDESDASSSGGDWEGADDDEVDDHIVDDEDEEDADMSDDEESVVNEEDDIKNESHGRPSSLVVSLRYQKPLPVVENSRSVSKEFTGQQHSPTPSLDPESGTKVVKTESRPEPTLYNSSAGLANVSTNSTESLFPQNQLEKPHNSIRNHYSRPAEDSLVEI